MTAKFDFDVFLCHHSADKPSIRHIRDLLQRAGLKPWFDEDEIRPGERWQKVLEGQIGSIRCAAVFVGSEGIGPWQDMEIDAFLREFVKRGCKVIPVLLPDAPDEPELPIFLQGLQWVDFRKDEPDPLAQLVWGVAGEKRESVGFDRAEMVAAVKKYEGKTDRKREDKGRAPKRAVDTLKPGAPSQISAPPAEFVGRREQLDDLRKAFDEEAGGRGDGKRGARQGAIISGVRGQGGVGKTVLALRLAQEIAAEFPDGRIFVDLRGAAHEVGEKPLTAAAAIRHVIRSFNPKYPEGEDDMNRLRGDYLSVLHGKRVLLLMDNAADESQVRPLLPPEGCALIVTSRWHFDLSGMRSLDLEEMRPDEAKALLLEIAPRTGAFAPAIAALCGHLPFALEKAAAAIKQHPSLSPEDYMARLGTKKERAGIGAQALSVSYDLLGADTEKDLRERWRALAVFPAPFKDDAAAAVWGVERDAALEALCDLYGASMIEWDKESGRYRLHDLARAYAETLLSEEEREEAGRRHSGHFLEVLGRCDEIYLGRESGAGILPVESRTGVSPVEHQGPDARATSNDRRDACPTFTQDAHGTVVGLRLFDSEWAQIETGQEWAAERWQGDDEAARMCADYPDAGIYCLGVRLHAREQIEWLSAAVEAAREIGDRRGEGNALGNLGLAYADLGDARKAIEFYEKDLVIAREIGDRRGEGNALGNLGLAYANLGDARKAIEFYEKRLVIAREIGDRRGEGAALGNLGLAYADLGDARKAIEFYEKALAIDREIGDRLGEGAALGNLGLAYADLGDARKAIEFYEKALAIDREIGDRRGEGAALGNLGLAYADLGDARKAIEYHEKALEIDREIGDRRGEGQDLGNLGLAYADLGDARKAIEFYEKQLVIAREIGDRRGEGNALWNMALALDSLGKRAEAVRNAGAALAIYEAIEDPNAEMVNKQIAKWKKQ